ncbi:MAG TPA: OsmC family protein [Azonexus sp.]|nr:OsmC family protein [Azonexus sp.]
MSDPRTFTIQLAQREDYEIEARFDLPEVPDLLFDEPAPLGAGQGPTASHVLAAAVGNCLTASLLFCLRKFKQQPAALSAEVTTTLAPNEYGRLRIAGIDAVIHLRERAGEVAPFEGCIQQFEDFCVVTDSIRRGVPVHVKVVDADDNEVYAADT